MAAGLLWVLDASINISMEPFRAFVADLLPDFQRTPGFAMQSLFIGLGAVVTSAFAVSVNECLPCDNNCGRAKDSLHRALVVLHRRDGIFRRRPLVADPGPSN